ncbi:MAG: zf-TFIIB domain-containing protein [Polyangiaceae bacterium]
MQQPLLCAKCGGPLPVEGLSAAATCPFCGTVNAPPPRVIEKTVERIVVVARGDDGSREGASRLLACPRCGSPMTVATSGETKIAGCANCGGIWLDPRAVDHARNVNDQDLLRVAFSIVGPFVPSKPDKDLHISCPVCGVAAKRVSILGDACAVDICAQHGTWFDREELDQFVSAHSTARAGEVTEDDLRAAGVGGSTEKGDIGFFGAMFQVAGFFGR